MIILRPPAVTLQKSITARTQTARMVDCLRRVLLNDRIQLTRAERNAIQRLMDAAEHELDRIDRNALITTRPRT